MFVRKLLFYPLIAVVCIFTSCYESQEGCLDSLASNYEISADRDCENCCQYPRVILRFRYLYNDNVYRFSDTIINNISTRVRLLDQNIFLSNISLETSLGEKIPWRDSISMFLSSQRIRQPIDFLQIRRNVSQAEISSVRFAGEIDNISLNVGLPPRFNGIDLQPSPHPALDIRDNMRDTLGNFFAARFNLVVGADLTDTIVVVVPASESFKINPLNKPEARFGQSIILELRLDYNQLFANIDFDSATITQISNQIRQNIVNSIVWDE